MDFYKREPNLPFGYDFGNPDFQECVDAEEGSPPNEIRIHDTFPKDPQNWPWDKSGPWSSWETPPSLAPYTPTRETVYLLRYFIVKNEIDGRTVVYKGYFEEV
jgi:hypothetical protein